MEFPEKQSKRMILENLAEIVLENILPHDYANETLHEIDGAIAAVEWEMEPLEVELIKAEPLAKKNIPISICR